jgi:hypothetical protein
MSKLFVFLSCVFLFCGCRTRYDIALNNGSTIKGASKPVFDKATGQYRYKDSNGQVHSVSAMRIRSIAPQGDADEMTDKKFKGPSTPTR